MRTLVTGGAGFIGSNLVDRLLVEGHEVDVVDDFSTGSLSNLAEARGSAGRALTIHHLDISAPAVIELMARRRPELVFHLAAQADVRVSVARPAFDATVNIVGSLNVLEGARQAEAERVVFAASGGTLYGEPAAEDLPVRESHPQQPLSPYGVAKKAVIDYLVAYRELHSLEFCALALGNVYGPRQDPHGEAGVVAIFAKRIVHGQPVTIFGDGEQTRDFVFVDDVVDAFVRAATRGGGLVCNIGTGRETSVNELLAALVDQSGNEVTSVLAPERPGELRRSSLDVERAAIQLGWRSWTELADGTRAVLEFVARQRRLRSAKEVFVRGTDHLGADRRRAQPLRRHPAHDRHRDAAVLAHHQLRGRGQLVGDTDLGGDELTSTGIGRALEVDDGGHTGATDGHIGDAAPPRPPERVGHDDPELDPEGMLAIRRGSAGPSGPSPRGATPPSRPPRWTGRCRRSRRRSRGGSH